MTQKWEEADVAVQDAVDDKEAVDDGITGEPILAVAVAVSFPLFFFFAGSSSSSLLR